MIYLNLVAPAVQLTKVGLEPSPAVLKPADLSGSLQGKNPSDLMEGIDGKPIFRNLLDLGKMTVPPKERIESTPSQHAPDVVYSCRDPIKNDIGSKLVKIIAELDNNISTKLKPIFDKIGNAFRAYSKSNFGNFY